MVNKYRNTTGIIFRLFNAKDADRVVHIITETGAKMAAVAPGVRKSTSRKAYAIDLLNTVSLKMTHGHNLETITEVQLINAHSQFKTEYRELMLVEFICEVLSLFLQEEQDEPAYYRNLENLLNVPSPHKPAILAAALILRFLHINGTLPKLNQDAYDGSEMPPESPRYPAQEVGYTVRRDMSAGEPVSDRLFKTQRFMMQYDFQQINRLDLTAEEQKQLLELHLGWLEMATDAQLKSAEMFRQSL